MVTRTRLRPVPAGGINQLIIAPPRAPVVPAAQVPECPDCPPAPPIDQWVDLHTLTDIVLTGLTRTGDTYLCTPENTFTALSVDVLTSVDPAEALPPSYLCLLQPEFDHVMLAQLRFISGGGQYLTDDTGGGAGSVFIAKSYFLNGSFASFYGTDLWSIGRAFFAYQMAGGIDGPPVRFKIKALPVQTPAIAA